MGLGSYRVEEDSGMSVLAVVDADKIHEYVFGPHELRMVRGGSVLEWVLNEEELPGLVKKHGGDKVYARWWDHAGNFR